MLVLVAAVALTFRLPGLNLRPMHADEAVHAVKFDQIWQHSGEYAYDPLEFHGPTLYYLTLPVVWLRGEHRFAETDAVTYRIVPAILGAGLILLLLLVRNGIGWPAVLCAGLLTALSPAMAFYSRYYIQETLLVFFSFLLIAAGWRYARTRRLGWALLAGAAAGCMHATKETAVIAWGAMAAAIVGVWLVGNRNPAPPAQKMGENESRDVEAAARTLPRPLPRREGSLGGSPYFGLFLAILAAVLVSVALFSGFFTNWQGPLDSVRAYTVYFSRAGGAATDHQHPWYYYLQLLAWWQAAPGPVWSEGLILILFVAGAVSAFRRPANETRLLRFLTLYSLALLVIYSAIPYKTPWCLLGCLHGMLLVAGAGAVALLRAVRWPVTRAVVALVLLAETIQLGWQSDRTQF